MMHLTLKIWDLVKGGGEKVFDIGDGACCANVLVVLQTKSHSGIAYYITNL